MDEQHRIRRKRRFGLSRLAIALILVLAIGAAGFFFVKYNDLKDNPEAEISQRNKEESERILGKVGALVHIPEDSGNPTVARVDDPEVLRKQNGEFYAFTEVGDYLILYPTRAIIYREANNQIINIAPIINTDNLPKPEEKTKESENTDTDTETTGNF